MRRMLPSGAAQGDGCSHDQALEMRLATRIFLQRTSTTCAPNTRIYGYIKGHFPASLTTAKPRFSIGPFGQCTTVTLAGYLLSLHKSHMALAEQDCCHSVLIRNRLSTIEGETWPMQSIA